jgi:hypothetical protein
LEVRFNTVKPAFLASVIDNGFMIEGVLNEEMTLRMGLRHAGQAFNAGAVTGRRNVNRPPHAAQSPSQSSYS